jgi:hypothetical protein
MSLETWLANRWLIEHQSSPQEVADLLSLIERDLSDSQSAGLSLDWSFCMVYNAALQVATLALHAAGYRAGRESHHERTIESLRFTLGASPKQVQVLQRFRRKRNIVEYDRVGAVSEQEREEMAEMARELFEEVEEWLSEHHPNLLGG